MLLEIVNYMKELLLSGRLGILLTASKLGTRRLLIRIGKLKRLNHSINERLDQEISDHSKHIFLNKKINRPNTSLFLIFMYDNNACIICYLAEIVLNCKRKMNKNFFEHLNC